MNETFARRQATRRKAVRDALIVSSLALSLAGCGEANEPMTPVDAGVEASPDAEPGPVTVTTRPDAPPLAGASECKVTVTTGIPLATAVHLAACEPISYATNPPSSGAHWPVWAAFGVYTTPVPRELYVHDLEHGAVVIAYRCEDACPDVVAALEAVFADATDTYCLTQAPGSAKRVILTPDPALETPIALAAWGATYTATCIDKASMNDFILAQIGRGPEAVCTDGSAPAAVLAACEGN